MNLRRAVAWSLLSTAAWLSPWLAACGSSKSGGELHADAAATADGQTDAQEGATGIGVITFSEAPDGGGTFFAGFSDRAPANAAGCQFVDAGGCTTATCPPPPASDGGTETDGAPQADAQPGVAPNPGRLKVSGGVFGSGFYIDPDNGGTYLYASPGTIFSPGDQLGVSALGGALPAFPEQTIEAPPVLALTAPGGDGGKITISTAQPLTFSWTGGRAGDETVVTATAYFTSGGLASMTCSWDASTGTATAPSDALRPLASQNALSSNIVWYQLAQKKFSAGPVAVSVSAYAPQGTLVSFQ
jgi:hypothetical protein